MIQPQPQTAVWEPVVTHRRSRAAAGVVSHDEIVFADVHRAEGHAAPHAGVRVLLRLRDGGRGRGRGGRVGPGRPVGVRGARRVRAGAPRRGGGAERRAGVIQVPAHGLAPGRLAREGPPHVQEGLGQEGPGAAGPPGRRRQTALGRRQVQATEGQRGRRPLHCPAPARRADAPDVGVARRRLEDGLARRLVEQGRLQVFPRPGRRGEDPAPGAVLLLLRRRRHRLLQDRFRRRPRVRRGDVLPRPGRRGQDPVALLLPPLRRRRLGQQRQRRSSRRRRGGGGRDRLGVAAGVVAEEELVEVQVLVFRDDDALGRGVHHGRSSEKNNAEILEIRIVQYSTVGERREKHSTPLLRSVCLRLHYYYLRVCKSHIALEQVVTIRVSVLESGELCSSKVCLLGKFTRFTATNQTSVDHGTRESKESSKTKGLNKAQNIHKEHIPSPK